MKQGVLETYIRTLPPIPCFGLCLEWAMWTWIKFVTGIYDPIIADRMVLNNDWIPWTGIFEWLVDHIMVA